jgi:lysophospholipase L1-like esterase
LDFTCGRDILGNVLVFTIKAIQMRKPLCLALIGLVSLAHLSAATAQQKANPAQQTAKTAQQKANDPTRWEKNIAAFEAQDRDNPPPKGALLFIGSSTIVRWKTLAEDFPEHKTINRGFGGSQIEDAAYYADRVVIPYAPRAVFLRAGGNDLNAGKSVEQVFSDFKNFVAKVHGKLPQTDIYYISLSPSIARWKQADKEKQLNDLMKEYVAGKPHLKYIETYDMVLGADGQPRPELFVDDKLHFNAEGNRLLAERVRPHLPK